MNGVLRAQPWADAGVDDYGFGSVTMTHMPFRHDRVSGVKAYEVTHPGGPLRVTLVWLDPVAAFGSARQLVRDFDLDVVRNNVRFHGNGGPRPDHTNNVERIDVDTALTDVVRVYIYGPEGNTALVSSHALTEVDAQCHADDPPRPCHAHGGWGTQVCELELELELGLRLTECSPHSCEHPFFLHSGQCVTRCSPGGPCTTENGGGVRCANACIAVFCAPGYELLAGTCAGAGGARYVVALALALVTAALLQTWLCYRRQRQQAEAPPRGWVWSLGPAALRGPYTKMHRRP